jgi:hypothetical protein
VTARVELIVYADAPIANEGRDARAIEPPRPDAGDLHGDGDALRFVVDAPHALALSFHDDGDLSTLHARAADALETIAARTIAAHPGVQLVVVDVLALDARPLLDGVRRLRAETPASRLWIDVRREGELFTAQTWGLRKLGLLELHVPALREASIAVVGGFLNKLAHYASTTGARIAPGNSVSFGWVDITLAQAEMFVVPRFVREALGDVRLTVSVPSEPTSDVDDTPVLGVTRAAATFDALVEACTACGLIDGVDVPRALSTAVICRRVGVGPVEARRAAPDEPSASGWVAICCGDHDHDAAASFEVVTLQQLAARAPRLYPMLAAPIGTGLAIGAGDELTIELPDRS